MLKVLVTDSVNPAVKPILSDVAEVDFREAMPEDELVKIIPEYDALMVRSQTRVTKRIIDASEKLKIIGRAGVGVDNIDLYAATNKGIIVTNSPDGNTIAAAEHTLAMMLAVTRNIVPASVSTKEGKWNRSKYTGRELFGKTLGILGFGRIGRHVGKVASAIGMKLVVFDPYANKEAVNEIGAEYITNLDDFLPVCDYITLHVPKNDETVNLINKNTIAKMKKNVCLINCSRGGIINESDLVDALQNGQVHSAAIDVFENEPHIDKCPLIKCGDRVVLTPHLGASTEEAQSNVAIDVAQQIRDVLAGGTAKSAVNIPSLRLDKLEPVKAYMDLAEMAGEFVSQMTPGKFQHLDITFFGDLCEKNVEPLEVAVLKGVLSKNFFNVNYVNAFPIAKERNIEVTSTKSTKSPGLTCCITVSLVSCTATNTITVCVIADSIYSVTKVNDYMTNIDLQRHILLCPHKNQPGMIAKVAKLLGDFNVNINSMNCSHNAIHVEKSLMTLEVDKPIEPTLLESIRQLPDFYEALYIHLSKCHK